MGTGAKYQLRIKDANGALVGVSVDFRDLTYTKLINGAGLMRVRYDDTSLAPALLSVNGGRVEVWRRREDANIAWYKDFVGFTGDYGWTKGNEGERFIARCPSALVLLAKRITAYPSDSARTNFTGLNGEAALKRLVQYNLTSSGTTADGRARNAYQAGDPIITLETDTSRGESNIAWAGSWKPLLQELARLAEVAGGDFDLVQTASSTFDFRFYPDQLGTDRSAEVVFAPELGNMKNPALNVNGFSRPNVAIVGGKGSGATRPIVVRYADDWTAGNSNEMWVDGSVTDVTAALEMLGDRALAEAQRKATSITFDVIQAGEALYGSRYFLGDRVTWRYHGVTGVARVWQVSISVDGKGDETIDVEVRGI